MASPLRNTVVLVLLLVLVAIAEATPPGIANNPSHARCLIKKYKMCYNLEHVCPKFCPDSCTVECVSCKPICGGSTAPPPDSDSPSPPEISPSGSSGRGKSPPPSDHGDEGGSSGKGGAQPPKSDNGSGDGKGKGDDGDGKGNGKGDDGDGKGNGKGDDGDGKGNGKGNDGDGKGKETPPESSPQSPPPTPATRSSPPPYVPVTPSSPPLPHVPVTPSSPPLPTPTPSSPSPVPITPSSPPPYVPVTPSSPPISSSQSPTIPSQSPPPTSSPTPSPPPSSPVPVPPTSDAGAGRRKRCKNRNFPQCYGSEHVCPSSCPNTCEVDCVTCKPVCKCDMPGAVCQDPRFIGGDGITFYFHGNKDQHFCLVTEPNLHINARFIGRRNENMKRDFTWVQSIAILFGDHQLFVGAKKTVTWNDANDRLSLAFDGERVVLPAAEGSAWQPAGLPSTAIKRDSDTNSVIIEVDGILKISAKVVSITQHESKVHNYGITEDDCFAHLELGFKFFSLSGRVDGVLGQTYRDNYVSRVKMGVPMPVLGGEREFAVSSLFATDCAASQFSGGNFQPGSDEDLQPGSGEVSALELPSMKCGTGIDGRGVVCKR